MRRVEIVCLLVALLALSSVSITAHSQGAAEDLTPCAASHPEPAQSGAWAVAFCNRTGHDLVLQLHDNDCPADNWSRRGNTYEKQLGRGESVTVPLCYARESQQSTGLAPGVPMLRLPAGKGVVTTWNIVGDCGDRSDRGHLDGRSFYDRGSYETGIILLQYPSSASHCFGAPASAEATSTAPTTAPAATPALTSAAAPATAVAATPALTSAAAPATAVAPPTGSPPSLSTTIDTKDQIPRVVHVFATSAPASPAYHCRFRLNLDFSDGLSWVDQAQADVPMGAQNASIYTRKYSKTVTKVALSAQKCAPL
jgi:hypothetical protein